MLVTVQIFVFPKNWAEHLLRAWLLLLVLTRGAGMISLGHIADGLFAARRQS